ncbi:MAG: hypothetical protein PHI42_05470 [Paludibacteraceae bacterium]|nr:hypothetical protein [Paludibacteraceae bacterium]
MNENINFDEEKLSNYAHTVLIVGKILSAVIFIAGFIVSGSISPDFEWIYLIMGGVISGINLFATLILSAFLKVISNISMSLKNK